jgi:hypothetical protein
VAVLSSSKYGFVKPRGISSDGKHVWVVSDGGYDAGDALTEMSASTGAVVKVTRDQYGGAPMVNPTAVSSDGVDVWVACSSSVDMFSASTGKFIKGID